MIKTNLKNIKDVYFRSNQIVRVYKGDILVYQKYV